MQWGNVEERAAIGDCEVLLEYCWSIVGVLLEYCCSIVGVLLEYCWSIVGVLLEYCWSIVGVLLEYCWSIVGVLLEYSRGDLNQTAYISNHLMLLPELEPF